MTRERDTTTVSRRAVLAVAASGAAGAVMGCVSQADDAQGEGVMFNVPRSSIPVVGTSMRFPVRRIYCCGRNYAAHAREMGSDPTREPPFFFQKPTDAIQVAGPDLTIDHPYPPMTKNYHYEVELVAALAKGGRDIPAERALDIVYGYAVGLDMTRRDLQRLMGDDNKPWELGKAFDHSAVISHLHPATQTGHLVKGAIWLKLNGETKQSSDLELMIWNVAEQIENLSRYYELQPGDIVYSGTPENVGPVVPGNVMAAHVDGLHDISVRVV